MHRDHCSEMAALLPRLRRFAFVLGGSRRDAERVVEAACQVADGEAARDSAEPRLDRRMFSLVYRIAARRSQDGDSVWPSSNEGAGPIERIRRRTASLTPNERAALALVVIDGRSYSEAAAILSLDVTAFANLLYSARMQLVEAP